MPNLRTVDRLQTAYALCCGEGGKRDEVHDDARCKPHREQQAERYTQPAMNENQRAQCGRRRCNQNLIAAEIS